MVQVQNRSINYTFHWTRVTNITITSYKYLKEKREMCNIKKKELVMYCIVSEGQTSKKYSRRPRREFFNLWDSKNRFPCCFLIAPHSLPASSLFLLELRSICNIVTGAELFPFWKHLHMCSDSLKASSLLLRVQASLSHCLWVNSVLLCLLMLYCLLVYIGIIMVIYADILYA